VSYQRKLGTGSDLVRTSRKLSVAEANAFMQQLAADATVESVQPDVMMHKLVDAPITPNDPMYTYQWHFRAGDGTQEKIGTDVSSYANLGGANVAKAWNLADGHGVTVAVLDTGITHHSDLDLSLADAGYDFISDAFVSGRADDTRVPGGWDLGDWTTEAIYTDPATGCVDASQAEDSSWHGTHVSGTISELTGNSAGMAGIANKARVLPVRVLGHCGYRRCHHLGFRWPCGWRAGQHHAGAGDQHEPGRLGHVFGQRCDRPGDCRCGQPRRRRGGGGRQQQRRCRLLLARQLSRRNHRGVQRHRRQARVLFELRQHRDLVRTGRRRVCQ
jgi:serine protease